MSESNRKAPPAGVRPVALLAAVLVVAVALYASRDALPPAAAVADDTEAATPTARAVKVANAFLDSLSDKQRGRASYDFDSKKKPNWSNLPVTMVPRNGVRMGDLSKDQRAKAMSLLAAVLSKDGYQKVIDIVDGDQQLVRGGKGGGSMFGADQYYLAIFGKPSEKDAWMVQFGGHHLGVNVTVIGKHFVLTPTHTGTQPAVFKRGGKEVRPLGLENDTAFKLIGALDEKQLAKAVIGERAQGELLLGPGRDGKKVKPQGIKGSALTAKQKALLMDLIGAWVNIVEPGSAKARLAEIKGKLDDTYFAWKGPTEEGSAVYFRVQGPSVVIEYAPQGSTDHIHTVVRNPNDDYGAGLLKKEE